MTALPRHRTTPLSRPGAAPLVVVAGLGTEYRRDDGIGPAVAAAVATRVAGVSDIGPISDPLDLLGLWDGAELAVVVDAVRSGAAPGTVRVVDITAVHLGGTASTHGISLAGVFQLARAVNRAPVRLVTVGVEGQDFGHGVGFSSAVGAAVPAAVRRVIDLIKELPGCV